MRNAIFAFALAFIATFAMGAQPRTTAIPHVSPEDFTNRVTFGSTLPPTIGAKNIVTSHTLPDAGVAPQAIEVNRITLSGGTFTYTFATAFSAVPTCVCSDIATTAAACSASGATASQVVLKGGATASLDVICVGAR